MHAKEKQPLGRWQAELAGAFGKGGRTLAEPSLQVLESADAVQRFLGWIVLEQSALADHLPLLGEDELDVGCIETLVFGDGFGEGIFRLGQRETKRRLEQRFHLFVAQIDGCLPPLAHDRNDLTQQLEEILNAGQRNVEYRDVLFQLGGDV